MIEVVPPQAAARVPVSKLSEAWVPPNGSSMWVCGSMPPGMTYLPVASTIESTFPSRSTPSNPDPAFSTAAMISPSTSTSAAAEPVALITVPFLIKVVVMRFFRSWLGDRGVGLGPPVPVELPGLAYVPDHVHVEVADHHLLVTIASHRTDHIALRIAELAGAVEGDG